MSLQLYLLPSLLGTLLGIGVAVAAARRHAAPAARYLACMGLVVAFWCFTQSLWVLAGSVEEALLANRLQYTAVLLTPVLWFQVALALVGRRYWLEFPRTLLFLVVPVVLLWCTWAYQPGEGPMWRSITLPEGSPVPRSERGPAFVVLAVYDYLLLIGGCLLLIAHYSQSPLYRMQLFVSGVFPIMLTAVNAAYISGHWFLPLDPTPFALAVGCVMMLWGVLRHRLLDLVPVGRAIAFDSLGEGVLILDPDGVAVDMNAAAARLLGRGSGEVLGAPLGVLLPGLGLEEACDGGGEVLGAGGAVPRRLQVHAACIGLRENPGGFALTLRDISAEHEARVALLEARSRLEAANAELARIAHTDALTGLSSRWLFLQRLDEEFARARRSHAPLALLLADLDHFKAVNDRHGHLAGDAVLEAAGTTLRLLKRPADVAARYGGEELAMLLPGAGLAGARAAAERMRAQLGALEHAVAVGAAIRVTASVGVALLEPGDADPRSLIARADRALYAAKAAGRDAVAVVIGEEVLLGAGDGEHGQEGD